MRYYTFKLWLHGGEWDIFESGVCAHAWQAWDQLANQYGDIARMTSAHIINVRVA